MRDFKNLIVYIESTLKDFQDKLPGIEKDILSKLNQVIKDLEIKNNKIRVSVKNLKHLSSVKSEIQKSILTPRYKSAVKSFVKSFDQISSIQNSYFKTLESTYSPSALQKEFLKASKDLTIKNVTSQLQGGLVEGISEIIQRAITNGIGYESLTSQLKEYVSGSGETLGPMQKHAKQISTDAINQYSRQYSKLVSDDLGLEWFRYSGSNLETSRPFCLACTDRKYFHLSEIPKLIEGDFPEFGMHEGVINPKTGLPQGMKPETDVDNFRTLLGGYNCGHQYRPVSIDLVPKDIQENVFASPEYKGWEKEKE